MNIVWLCCEILQVTTNCHFPLLAASKSPRVTRSISSIVYRKWFAIWFIIKIRSNGIHKMMHRNFIKYSNLGNFVQVHVAHDRQCEIGFDFLAKISHINSHNLSIHSMPSILPRKKMFALEKTRIVLYAYVIVCSPVCRVWNSSASSEWAQQLRKSETH